MEPQIIQKIKGENPVLVDFYADWCAPCRMLTPIINRVSEEMAGKVEFVKVNVDENKDAVTKFDIQSIPTVILFHKGAIKWKGSGLIQADQMREMIEKNI